MIQNFSECIRPSSRKPKMLLANKQPFFHRGILFIFINFTSGMQNYQDPIGKKFILIVLHSSIVRCIETIRYCHRSYLVSFQNVLFIHLKTLSKFYRNVAVQLIRVIIAIANVSHSSSDWDTETARSILSIAYQRAIREGYRRLKILMVFASQHLFYLIRFQKIDYDSPSTTVLASFIHEFFNIRSHLKYLLFFFLFFHFRFFSYQHLQEYTSKTNKKKKKNQTSKTKIHPSFS